MCAAATRSISRLLPVPANSISTRQSPPIGVIFTGIFMSMLDICGSQLTKLTAFNEYITDVIIAVIVYMSAFALLIKTMLGKRRRKTDTVLETAGDAAPVQEAPVETAAPEAVEEAAPETATPEQPAGEEENV